MKTLKSYYFNGGLELVLMLLSVPVLFVSFIFEALQIWPIYWAITVVFTVMFFVPFAYFICSTIVSQKNDTFTIRRTLSGVYTVNQNAKKDGGCFVTEFQEGIKNGLNTLKDGTYICYTHECIITRIERYARTSSKTISIVEKPPLKKSRLLLVKLQLRKRKACKECRRRKDCVFFKKAEKHQMYGVKFIVKSEEINND